MDNGKNRNDLKKRRFQAKPAADNITHLEKPIFV
jgi:hypothetical protein